MSKYPVNGEQAYRITSPMLQALSDLDLCMPAPHFIPNRSVAVALLNRNWVKPAEGPGREIESKTLYYLTAAGSKVLRIERKRERSRA